MKALLLVLILLGCGDPDHSPVKPTVKLDFETKPIKTQNMPHTEKTQ